MAKSDAEISLKVNMPPPSDFQKMLERANKIIADNKKQLEEYRKTVAEVAEGARIMEQRARATGSAEMVKTARAQFNEGWKTASTLDAREARLSQGLGTVEGRVGAVAAARAAGEVTDEQAVALLAKYTEELEKASAAVDDLGYSLEVTKGDLFTAEAFDEMLGKYDAFRMTMSDTGQAARDFAAEMRQVADAFAEEREGLDASMPGYEQQSAKLLQLEREYKGLASAADAVTGTLQTSQAKVKEALDAYDGSAEAQKKVYEAIDAGSKKALEADTKLQGIAEKRALSEQKRAADEEKAREREAEAARKRAEAEAERARKEEALRVERERKEAEAAAKREAREAEMAARDAERFEREQFQMKISALSKQELIKVLDDLRKAREAASKADDAETYAKRTREFNMAREQMERTNAALNVQKMMFMQQAAAVQSMARNLGALGDSLENVSKNAKDGELNMVGMAQGVMELYSQFQAGLGPIGWFMMALQGLQTMMNRAAKEQKVLAEGARKTSEDMAAVAKANEEVKRAVDVAAAQENLQERLNALRSQYAAINGELDRRVKLLQATRADAEEERNRMAAEEEHQRNLLRMDLERKMLRGEMTREEYDNKLQDFSFESDVKGAQRAAESKRQEADALREEARLAKEAAKAAKEAAQGQRERREAYTLDERTVEKLEQAEAAAKGLLDAAQKESAELNAQKPGFTYNPGENFLRLVDARLELEGIDSSKHGYSDAARWARRKQQLGARVSLLAEAYNTAKLDKNRKLGGVSAEEYLRQLEEAKAELALMEQAENEAAQRAEEAEARAKKAEEEAAKAEEYARDVKRRTTETQTSLAETRTTKKDVDAEVAKLEQELAELRNKVGEMTDEEVESMLERSNRYARKYGEGTPKGNFYRRRAKTLREERLQRRRDRKVPGYVEWMVGEGAQAFADGQGTEKQIARLLSIYEKAKKTTTKTDDELAAALIKLIDLETVKNKTQRGKIKVLQEKTSR